MWPAGGLWRTFYTVGDMKTWLNDQLSLTHPNAFLELETPELAFRHMDINTRNLMLTTNNEICVLDWQFAGNFPSVFELLHLKVCEAEDRIFFGALLEEIPETSEELETCRYKFLCQIMSNNIQYGTKRVVPPP